MNGKLYLIRGISLKKKKKKVSSCSTGGWEVQDQGPTDYVSGKYCLPGSQMQSSYCVLRQQKEQGSYLGSVKRALILFMRASPL